MAITIAFTRTINSDGDTYTVTDATGQYNGATNPGGYGTPNQNLNDLALLGIAFRTKRDLTQEVLVAVTPSDQLHHDNGAADSKINTFTFTHNTDGTIKFGIVALQVYDGPSGIAYRSGPDAVVGDYYYDSQTDTVKIVTSIADPVVGTTITDYTLFDESALQEVVAQTITEELLTPDIQIKLGEYWQEYKDYREVTDSDVLADTALDNFSDIHLRLIGANYDFDAGNPAEARYETYKLRSDYSI